MRVILILVGCALAACSQAQKQANETNETVIATNSIAPVPATKKDVPGFEGYPTTQPNGSPLTEQYCSDVGDQPGSPFDNTKTCLLIACQLGDKPSCKMAETYNGNLWPDGVPPDEEGNETNKN